MAPKTLTSMQMCSFRTSTKSLLTVALACLLFGCSQNSQTQTQTASASSRERETATSTGSTIVTTEKRDEKSYAKALAAKVFTPDKNSVGQVKIAYMAARQIPVICTKLFCYCGCDGTEDHTSLFDCYKDNHSVDCDYCKGEAVLAFKMNKKGCSIADIQKAVDLNWGPHYPWYKEPSDTIKKYWKTRLWAPGITPTIAEKYFEGPVSYDPFKETLEKLDKKIKLPSGSCCGGSKDVKTARSAKQ